MRANIAMGNNDEDYIEAYENILLAINIQDYSTANSIADKSINNTSNNENGLDMNYLIQMI